MRRLLTLAGLIVLAYVASKAYLPGFSKRRIPLLLGRAELSGIKISQYSVMEGDNFLTYRLPNTMHITADKEITQREIPSQKPRKSFL